jgi:hypothetical protein
VAKIFGNSRQRSALDLLTSEESPFQIVLLSGPEAVGKRSHLLESLEALDPPPDLSVPDPSAEEVREGLSDILSAPSFGPYRALVLEGLDTASEASVSACLKLFEEPPPGSRVFLLSEDPSLLPDPLLSRIQQTVRFGPLSVEEVRDYAKSVGEVNDFSVRVCSGRPGIYGELSSDPAYEKLWETARLVCFSKEVNLRNIVPEKIRDLPDPKSPGRLAASLACFDAAKSSLAEGGDRKKICGMLRFSSTLLRLSKFDASAHWVRTIFPV